MRLKSISVALTLLVGVATPAMLRAQAQEDKLIRMTIEVGDDSQAHITSSSGMSATNTGWRVALREGQNAVFRLKIRTPDGRLVTNVYSMHGDASRSTRDVPQGGGDIIVWDFIGVAVYSPPFPPGERFRISIRLDGGAATPILPRSDGYFYVVSED